MNEKDELKERENLEIEALLESPLPLTMYCSRFHTVKLHKQNHQNQEKYNKNNRRNFISNKN